MGWNITVNGVLITTRANRQTFTANSTHEAEVVACHDCMEDVMMHHATFTELGFKIKTPMTLHCDNNAAVLTYATEVPEWRSPTLGSKFYHSRDYIDWEQIKVVYIGTTENNADIHTKWLPSVDHHRHMRWMGLYDPSALDQSGGVERPG